MQDIFIDSNVASKFANPADPEYKALIAWLRESHPIGEGQPDDRAYLVASQKLLSEYSRSCRGVGSNTSIPSIVDKLTREGRLVKIKKKQIDDFKGAHFTKSIKKNLRSNSEDWDHIPVVLLSERKYALTYDANFTYDLEHFPGYKYKVLVRKRPEEIPYDKLFDNSQAMTLELGVKTVSNDEFDAAANKGKFTAQLKKITLNDNPY